MSHLNLMCSCEALSDPTRARLPPYGCLTACCRIAPGWHVCSSCATSACLMLSSSACRPPRFASWCCQRLSVSVRAGAASVSFAGGLSLFGCLSLSTSALASPSMQCQRLHQPSGLCRTLRCWLHPSLQVLFVTLYVCLPVQRFVRCCLTSHALHADLLLQYLHSNASQRICLALSVALLLLTLPVPQGTRCTRFLALCSFSPSVYSSRDSLSFINRINRLARVLS